MRRMRWLGLLLAFVLMGGVMVACGGSDDDADVDSDVASGQIDVDAEDVTEDDTAMEDEDSSSMDEEDEDDSVAEAEPEEEMADEDMAGGMSVDEIMADPLGVIELDADEPVEIGSMFVLSGPNESLGVDSRDGVDLAIEAFGDFLGHEIVLTAEDSQCNPEGGQTAATRLAANENIVGVIGTSCSGAAEPAIPIICEAGMAMLSPSNTAPKLTATDRPSSFGCYLRTAHNDLFQGRVAADFAYTELGLTKAATIHDGSPYAEELQNVFALRFEELGGEITAQEAVNVNDTDMSPVLTSIAATEPQAIYYPIFTAEGGFVTAQARETAGLEDVALIGADGLFSADFVEAAGDAASGVYLSGPFVGDSSLYEDFLVSLETKYGRGPLSGFHAHAYDATMILLNAALAASAETEDGGLVIGRQAMLDALYATEGYEGLTGSLSCDELGDCATGEALAVFEITEEVTADPEGTWPPDAVYQP